MRLRVLVAVGVALAGWCIADSEAHAFGRQISGGHPYHNGAYFIPPASAYEAVSYRPPFRYGVPAYYYPESYLAPGVTYYPVSEYPWFPPARAGYYYMSAHSYYYSYPW